MKPRKAISPHLLLAAYSHGLFPMAEDGEGIQWHDPDPRAVFPLERIAPNARLRTYIRSNGYRCTIDRCFEEVMRNCAARESTWITEELISNYCELHRQGFAHSVEAWKKNVLIGGVYGVSIGAAFFGESMFSRATNASKAAFHHLAAHLRERRFLLFDSQYINDHTRSLGAVEIPRGEFMTLLTKAIKASPRF